MVFRETETRTSYQMAKEMEGAGGELNAFTARELTAFYGITIRETRDVAKEMVSDIVAHPKINDEDVRLEKKIVLQELSMIENEPESYIHDLFSQDIWRGHKLCQDEGGSPDIVKGLEAKDLRAYYEARYGIPNLAVFAAGNVDIDDTVAWASEKFDGMTSKMNIVREPPKKPVRGYNFVRTIQSTARGLGVPAYGTESIERVPALLLSSVLVPYLRSRRQGVREEEGTRLFGYTHE